MSEFVRSLRSLERDRPRAIGWIVLGLAVLAAVLAWAVFAEVPLVVTSTTARLETEAEVHPVQSTSDGLVAQIHVELGQAVAAGDVLIELDRSELLANLAEETARRDALQGRIAHAQAELAVLEELAVHETDAAQAAHVEALAKVQASRTKTRFARAQARRAEALAAAGAISAVETDGLRADAAMGVALDRAGSASATHLEREARVRGAAGRARIAELEGLVTQMQGETAVIDATLARLRQLAERRLLRSPVDGVVGEISRAQVGTVVAAGERLASVVPPGSLRVTGEFRPADVSGRVLPGASARVRLDGFPWLRHGMVLGRVAKVASEVRDGTLRVDIDITEMPATITPHHGAPGAIELEVGRVSPLSLLLRRSMVPVGDAAAAAEVPR